MSDSALAPWSITEVAPEDFAVAAVRRAADLLRAGVLLESGRPQTLPADWKEKLQSEIAQLEQQAADLRAEVLAAGGKPIDARPNAHDDICEDEASENEALLAATRREKVQRPEAATLMSSAPVTIGVAPKRRPQLGAGAAGRGDRDFEEDWELLALLEAHDWEANPLDGSVPPAGTANQAPKAVSLGVRKMNKVAAALAADSGSGASCGCSGDSSGGATLPSAASEALLIVQHVPRLPGAEPAELPLPQFLRRGTCITMLTGHDPGLIGAAATAAVAAHGRSHRLPDAQAAGEEERPDHEAYEAARCEPQPPACTELPLSGGYALGAGLHLLRSLATPTSAPIMMMQGHEQIHWGGARYGYEAPPVGIHLPLHQRMLPPGQWQQYGESPSHLTHTRWVKRVHWRGSRLGGLPYRGAAPVQAQLAAAGILPTLLLQLQTRGLERTARTPRG